MVQRGLAGTQRLLRLGPNFSLDATAADRSRDLSALKEEHLRTALLRRRTTSVGDRRDDHAFATFTGFIDHAIQIALRNRRHRVLFCVLPFGEIVYVIMATSPNFHRRISDRPLYLLAAVIVPLVVLAGFARTYYLKGFFATPVLPSMIVHVHGLIMTAWVVLFIVQVTLVAKRKTKLHQRLGVFGAILAGLVFVVGILTGLYAAARAVNDPNLANLNPPPLAFLIIPLGDMVAFAILVGTALYYRKRLDIHKRLMLVAAINITVPAIARIPVGFIANGGALVFFGLADLILLGFLAFDTIRHKRVHPALLWGTVFVIVFQPLRIILAGTHAWTSFAAALVRLVQ